MAAPHRVLLRSLADWSTGGFPVTTLYLDVDGRRRPRRAEWLGAAEALLRRSGEEYRARTAERERTDSAARDVDRILRHLTDRLDRRGNVRGVAVFSSAGADLWADVPLSRPVRDRSTVAPRPDLVPLEALVERAESICTAVVGREKARVFLTTLGEVEELPQILDEVPGRHDQGGWAQARLQRHTEDHVQRHLKHTAEFLLRLRQDGRFDHLVLGGSPALVAELERDLHEYVRPAIVERASLPIAASAQDVLAHALDLERRLEEGRERRAVERLMAEWKGGTGRAVAGWDHTLPALEAGRVDTLVLPHTGRAGGVRCPRCGHLEERGRTCAMCGTATEEADLVEEAVEAALRRGCRVETVSHGAALEDVGGVGALLRF
jgi:peptide chain release factor subunit 1